MRLLKLRVRGFKGLKDVELDLDHDHVLIAGPNEAGKSSLLEALVTGLYGLAPAKRGSGHAGALKEVLPWTGEPAAVALTFALDDGRELEVDWDLSGERTRVINRSVGQDISAAFPTGTHGWLDVGDTLLHLPGSVFNQVACVGEGELARISDDAEVRQSLLRVTDAGVDVLVEQAIARLQEGARQATVPKVNAATRRNNLERELSGIDAQLAQVRAARENLEGEVDSISDTEAKLRAAGARAAEIADEAVHRDSGSARLRVELERARGRLSEAELRAAAIGVDGLSAAPDQPAWTDEEMEQALQALVGTPTAADRRQAPIVYSLLAIMVGVAALVAGVVLGLVAVDAVGAGVIALGVYLATRGGIPVGELLMVGERRFASRQELMSAIDRERADRDCQQQGAAVALLERQLQVLEEQAEPENARGGGALADLSIRELERLSKQAVEEVQRLTIDVASQKASLERGHRQIPEVAPLEERALQLRLRVEHLDAFGSACLVAAETLASASEEIRRAYAPKLQACLSRDLARVTDGRYGEALVSDRFEVHLRAPETKSMVDLKHLSRGTQQQIYLLLRLGLLEVMAGGTETLPLFLDDALALADDDRRAELLKVLEGQQCQVVYFTAGEAEAATLFDSQWHRIDLPRPLHGAEPGAEQNQLKLIARSGA